MSSIQRKSNINPRVGLILCLLNSNVGFFVSQENYSQALDFFQGLSRKAKSIVKEKDLTDNHS